MQCLAPATSDPALLGVRSIVLDRRQISLPPKAPAATSLLRHASALCSLLSALRYPLSATRYPLAAALIILCSCLAPEASGSPPWRSLPEPLCASGSSTPIP